MTTVLITLSSLCTSLCGPSPSRVCIWKPSEGSPTFMVRKGHPAPSSQMPVSLGTVIGRARAQRHRSEAGIQAAEPGPSKGAERQERSWLSGRLVLGEQSPGTAHRKEGPRLCSCRCHLTGSWETPLPVQMNCPLRGATGPAGRTHALMGQVQAGSLLPAGTVRCPCPGAEPGTQGYLVLEGTASAARPCPPWSRGQLPEPRRPVYPPGLGRVTCKSGTMMTHPCRATVRISELVHVRGRAVPGTRLPYDRRPRGVCGR